MFISDPAKFMLYVDILVYFASINMMLHEPIRIQSLLLGQSCFERQTEQRTIF